jgi:putative autoinducer-2 (AI-2) aldolase
MDWGWQNRMSRMFPAPTGRTVMLAVDHGYFMGPTHGLEVPRLTLAPLLGLCDAVALTRGVLRTSVPPSTGTPVVLRVSGGASVVGADLSHEALTTSVEDALRLNVSAVAMSIFVGSAHEHESIVNLGALVDQGEAVGLPVMGITAVGKELDKRDARYLSLASRIAAEQGAHVVKTYYCEDGFSRVVEGCPVPIVVAGGPRLETDRAVLELVHASIAAGARGVDMGRNIWQSDHPVAMLRAIRAIVHEGYDVKEALQALEEARLAPTAGAPRSDASPVRA